MEIKSMIDNDKYSGFVIQTIHEIILYIILLYIAIKNIEILKIERNGLRSLKKLKFTWSDPVKIVGKKSIYRA